MLMRDLAAHIGAVLWHKKQNKTNQNKQTNKQTNKKVLLKFNGTESASESENSWSFSINT